MDYAQNLNNNVKALLEAQNTSMRQFAERLSIPASTLIDSLKSKKGLPLDIAVRVAESLGFSVEDLTKMSTVELLKSQIRAQIKNSDLSDDEARLLSDYRSLNTHGQEYIRQTMDMAKDRYKKHNSVPNMEASKL